MRTRQRPDESATDPPSRTESGSPSTDGPSSLSRRIRRRELRIALSPGIFADAECSTPVAPIRCAHPLAEGFESNGHAYEYLSSDDPCGGSSNEVCRLIGPELSVAYALDADANCVALDDAGTTLYREVGAVVPPEEFVAFIDERL